MTRPLDLERLRAVAVAGHLAIEKGAGTVVHGHGGMFLEEADKFASTFTPDNCLALLDRVTELERAHEQRRLDMKALRSELVASEDRIKAAEYRSWADRSSMDMMQAERRRERAAARVGARCDHEKIICPECNVTGCPECERCHCEVGS